jgi:5'-nucleotidase
MRPMEILLTNDDGIHSNGLWAMAEALAEVGTVSVVAPDRDQSGIGTARTLRSMIRTQDFAAPTSVASALSVEGTPSDCVILAVESLHPGGFDMVFSGINEGANLGMDVLASGTVGAALQGYLRGIPSVAMSVTALTDLRHDAAAATAGTIARVLANAPEQEQAPFLNVNLPNIEAGELDAVELTELGPRAWAETVESHHDGKRTTFWIKHNLPVGEDAQAGTDVWAVRNNRVSITSLNGSLSSIEGTGLVRDIASRVAGGLNLEA